MKKIIYTILGISLLIVMSCGPNAEQKAAVEKAKLDSVADATKKQILNEQYKAAQNAIAEKSKLDTAVVHTKKQTFIEQLNKAQDELSALKTDPNYLYIKTRLATVRARVSTGGSYGWIDKDGIFWSGKDANKAFDNAAEAEKNQLVKIDAKQAEIDGIKDRLKNL